MQYLDTCSNEVIEATIEVLKIVKSGNYNRNDCVGICGNMHEASLVYGRGIFEYIGASFILEEMYGENVSPYIVEEIHKKLSGDDYSFKSCMDAYATQRNKKWDTENNPYAVTRYELLDKMIAFLEEKYL
ncbi:apoptosis-inducing factor 2 [Pectobacterium phage POP12]|nr:apoptosis-inducing factor 2 [Pectobacterium phage POP12]